MALKSRCSLAAAVCRCLLPVAFKRVDSRYCSVAIATWCTWTAGL
jgi:hypothetical protein